MLLLNVNRTVTITRLVDAAWDADPPATARRQVQNRVAGLRALLAPHGGCLLTQAAGYSLTVERDELDAGRFERLAATAAGRNALPEKIKMFQDALALWRGPALDGLDSPALTPAADLLNERRLQILGDYIDLQLEAGRHETVIPELAGLKTSYPLQERFFGQWMRAVSAAGRRAEALDAYHEFRSQSVQELGLEPGADLQRIYLALLRDDRVVRGNTASPTTAPAQHDIAPPIPRQLPRDLPSFVARQRELSELTAALADPARVPVIVIHGASGVGKSTLALHAAHCLSDSFADGQLYVDLQGFTPGHQALPPANVLDRFLRALGLPSDRVPAHLDEASARFRSETANRRLLVVLDNARDLAQVAPLIPGSAGCAVLITSRRMLTAIDGARHIHLCRFSERDAFGQLAGAVGEQRVMAEPEAAADIVRFCGYMPLALRLASAQLRPNMPLRAVADRLADARHRLDHLELPEIGVRASLSISHHVLRASPDPINRLAERGLLLLSLLDGPDVSPAVAARLLDESGVMTERCLDRLVEASLIDVLESGRYRMHDLLRLYGREQAADTSAAASALTRAFGMYVGTAWNASSLIRPGDHRLRLASRRWRGAALSFPDAAAALDWSEEEHQNIMAAIQQSASASDIPAAIPIQLTLAMFGFFRVRGYWNDAVDAAEQAAAAACRVGDRRAEAWLRSDRGRALVAQGNLEEAAASVDSAITFLRNIGDREGLAQALSNMGVVHCKAKRLDQAMTCYCSSLSIHKELGNLRGQAMTLDNLGPVYRMKGLFTQALSCHEQALAIFRDLNDRYGQAVALIFLGVLYREAGRCEDAVAFIRKSLAIYREMGDRHGEAECLRNLGVVYRAQKRNGEALEVHEAALAICRNIGIREPTAEALHEKALTLQAIGREAEAQECFRQAADISPSGVAAVAAK